MITRPSPFLAALMGLCLVTPAAWLSVPLPALAASDSRGWAAAQAAEGKQVEVEGRGLSEREALQDAFRNAIEAVVGVMVSAETEVANFQTVRDRVFAHAEGYVSGFWMRSG